MHDPLDTNQLILPTYEVDKEQRDDAVLSKIIDTLEHANASRREKRKFKNYLLKDDQLYKRSKLYKEKFLLCIPRSMVSYVLQEAHDTPTGGHFGINRTLEAIRSRFYWQTLDHDVREYVKTCVKCQKRKSNNQLKQGLMIPMPIPIEPFEIVGMDLMGPLPTTGSKNQHVLVITDYLTKFVIATALRKTTSLKIAECLKRLLFFQYGIPKKVISDNGANLTSFEMRKLFDLL